MPLIIDCYNLLHAEKPAMFAAMDEHALCLALARSTWARDAIEVVCDGSPKPLGLLESPAPQVTLTYSGAHRIADEVIIEKINASSSPRRLIIVSSDNEIRQAARRRRSTSWSSEDFLGKLAASLRHAPAAPPRGKDKPTLGELPPHEVDHWLDEFGFPGEKNKPTHRRDPPHAHDDDDGVWPPW